MGLFGPSKVERAARALATQTIVRHQGYARHLEGTFPEFDAVVIDAIKRSGRDPRNIDVHLLKKRLIGVFMAQLEKYCEGSYDLKWDNLMIVMERPDFSLPLLTDYLTGTARGVVAHNKLVGFMNDGYPNLLAKLITEGSFNLATR